METASENDYFVGEYVATLDWIQFKSGVLPTGNVKRVNAVISDIMGTQSYSLLSALEASGGATGSRSALASVNQAQNNQLLSKINFNGATQNNVFRSSAV